MVRPVEPGRMAGHDVGSFSGKVKEIKTSFAPIDRKSTSPLNFSATLGGVSGENIQKTVNLASTLI